MEQINFLVDGEIVKAYYSDELSYGHNDDKYVLVYSFHGIHAVIRMHKDNHINCAMEEYLEMGIHHAVPENEIPENWDDLGSQGMIYCDAQGVIYTPDALSGSHHFREVTADKVMLAISTKD